MDWAFWYDLLSKFGPSLIVGTLIPGVVTFFIVNVESKRVKWAAAIFFSLLGAFFLNFAEVARMEAWEGVEQVLETMKNLFLWSQGVFQLLYNNRAIEQKVQKAAVTLSEVNKEVKP